MLWKKESQSPDALYINVLGDERNVRNLDVALNFLLLTLDQEPRPEKSDSIALQKRNDGNKKFRVRAYIEAMELYSDSLRFAKPESEHICLAYANRAACFLVLKMYENCLKDIEFAIKAGYPGNLMRKLEERKAKCLQEMQEDPQPYRKTSIEPDDQFPYMANVAQVQKNKKGGYSVVAKADIDVGQTIVAEDAYIAYLSDHFGSKCQICVKEYVNLVPCKKCTVAMFCPDCQGHFLHEFECGLNLCGENKFNSALLGLVRAILLTLKAFPNVDELMKFVEQIQKNPTKLPEHLLDDRSKYQVYIGSPIESRYESVDKMAQMMYPAYKLLFSIPHVKELFKLEKHRRFLMHLIAHQMMIPDCTACFPGFIFPDYDEPSVRVSLLMQRYFKHSCNPNLVNFVRDGKNIWFSVKPIKKGEQLFISYAPLEMNSTQERQEFLWKRVRVKCACPRCKGKTPSAAQQQRLVSDPAYRYFQSNKQCYTVANMDIEKLKPLMDNCVTVLRNYGHLHWSSEIGDIIEMFQSLYFIQSTGGTDFNHPLAHALLAKFQI